MWTSGSASGNVELQRATQSSSYATIDLKAVTPFGENIVINGVFKVRGGSLFFIQTFGMPSGNVEVFATDGPAYTNTRHYISGFDFGPDTAMADGQWHIGPNADLYFIKTSNCASMTVEVYVATFSSLYQTVNSFAPTSITLADQFMFTTGQTAPTS